MHMEKSQTGHNLLRGALALLLAIAILCCGIAVPAAVTKASAASDGLHVMAMSDPHMLDPGLVGNTKAFKDTTEKNRKMFKESAAIISAQLQKVKDKKPDVLLIAGDLSKDGELESHRHLEAELEKLHSQLPNMKIYVTNGNHDINNKNAKNYNTGGDPKAATRTSPEAFASNYSVTYKDKSIIARYTPTSGKAGMLSYVARPKKGFTFIVIDSGRYSSDNTDNHTDEHQTSGQITDELRQWVLNQIESAKRRGDMVIGMEHHNMVPHFSWEPIIRPEFLINDNTRLCAEYANAGMHFVFTGHMHSQDVSTFTSSEGNKFYDIETAAGISYPSPMRDCTISRSMKNGKRVETVTGKTIEGESFTYTDPTVCEQATIKNLKTYGQGKIISRKATRQMARDYLSRNMKAAGLKYNSKDYSDKVNSIINGCMDVKVCNDGSKNLYDYVSYAYVHYLAGEDSQKKPDWFKQAEKRLNDGTLLSNCLYVISGKLKDFDQNKAKIICQYLFFPQAMVGRYGLNSANVAGDVLRIPTQSLDTMSDKDFSNLNQLYYDVVRSISYDTNFHEDKNFTINV